MNSKIFTSESVTEGHPDKICDQISDAILDALLSYDKNSRVACEVSITTGMIHIMGEVSSKASIDYSQIARNVVRDIGYTSSDIGFDADTCAVLVSIDKQSSDIAQGVNCSATYNFTGDTNDMLGAGDQGMVFGYACDETPEYMPLSIILSHKLSRRLTEVRKEGIIKCLRPDGKTQISVEYNNDGYPIRLESIVISTQHDPNVDMYSLLDSIKNNVIYHVVPMSLIDEKTSIYINPTGRFVIGGPCGDSGLTGRKIIVDTYGGIGRHGGGAFSGKDPTKVDRSGAYMARYIAKNIVASGIAKKCEIQIAYVIGIANPVSVNINTFGTGIIDDDKIAEIVTDTFDMRPSAIIKNLNLCRPIYRQTASYGHFGRNETEFSWEKIDKAEMLKERVFFTKNNGEEYICR